MGKAERPGLNRRQVIAIWSNQVYQGIQITLPYTLAVFLVRHFEAGQSEERIGRLTGILAASFSAAQFFTSYLWGVFMDRFGRKPVILLSNVVTGTASVGLGLAGSYALAITCRLAGGLFNGSGVAVKTIMGESCTAEDQARGMAVISLGWGMGSVLGPLLGGALSNPCTQWHNFPLCSPGSLLDSRPFLLPCLVTGLACLASTLTNSIWLEETLPRLRSAKAARTSSDSHDAPLGLQIPLWRKLAQGPSNLAALLRGYSSLSGEAERDSNGFSRDSEGMELAAEPAGRQPSATQQRAAAAAAAALPAEGLPASADTDPAGAAAGVGRGSAADGPQANGAAQEHRQAPQAGGRQLYSHFSQDMDNPLVHAHSLPLDGTLPAAGLSRTKSGTLPAAAQQQWGQYLSNGEVVTPRYSLDDRGRVQKGFDDSEGESDGEDGHDRAGLLGKAGNGKTDVERPLDSLDASPNDGRWWRERPLQVTLAGYGSTVFLFNVMDELTPLFASAPEAAGGLNLRTDQLAWPLSVSGLTLVVFALVIYPRLQARLGPLAAAKLGLLAAIPIVMLVPATSLVHGVVWRQLALTCALSLRTMAGQSCMTSSMIMINLSAPPTQIGAVNGAGNTIAAFMRALGPALCGFVWAFTVQSGVVGQQYLSFAAVSAAMLMTRLLYIMVDLFALGF